MLLLTYGYDLCQICVFQGLEEVVVESKHEVLRILEEGSLRRTTAATKMNASSSRSHTVFTITVTITEKSIVGQGRRYSKDILIC